MSETYHMVSPVYSSEGSETKLIYRLRTEVVSVMAACYAVTTLTTSVRGVYLH